jgi:hypothetical protein
MMRKFAAVGLMLTLGLGTAVLAAEKFKSVWKAPDIVGMLGFAGKKVVAVVMTGDQNLEVAGEESLTRELTTRGVNGVAAYRMIPREELQDKDKAKAWFTRSKVEGVVVMRVLSSDHEVTYRPDMWVTTSYSTLWSYWGYGWTSVYVPGGSKNNLIINVETLIFDVTKDKLIWAGVSEKTNPKNVQRVVGELVTEVISEMKKDGLVPLNAK